MDLSNNEVACQKKGMVYFQTLDVCLYRNNDRMNWPAAEAFCESLGGHLLEIKTEEVQNGFAALLESLGGEDWLHYPLHHVVHMHIICWQ